MTESKNEVKFKQDHIPNSQGGLVAAAAEKGAKEYQEDSWIIFCSEDKTFTAGCIFDGHGGKNGMIASRKCAQLSWELFKKDWRKMLTYSEAEWRTVLKNFFSKLHQTIRKDFVEAETNNRQKAKQSTKKIVDKQGIVRKITGFPIHGGTTGTVCIVVNTKDKRQCICANVGDSDALLLPANQKLLPGVQKNYLHLSVDHGPESSKEWERIDKLPKSDYPDKLLFVYDMNNTYRKYECPKVFLENGPQRGSKDPEYVKDPWGKKLRPTNVRYDPAVYAVSPYGVEEDVTCIAMTRALGDFYAHQFGLTWEPDIHVRKLDEKSEFLITVGSDGIWDCWKFEDFSDFVTSTYKSSPNDLLKATTSIVSANVSRAKSLFGKRSFDDSSLCLLFVPKR